MKTSMLSALSVLALGATQGMLAGCETKLIMPEPIRVQMEFNGPTAKYEGVYISDALLDRVKLRETGIDWLVAVFGEPTSRSTLRDGTQIWKWAYRPLEEKAAMVSVFGGGSKDEPTPKSASAFVWIREGVVIEKWRD